MWYHGDVMGTLVEARRAEAARYGRRPTRPRRPRAAAPDHALAAARPALAR
jgi:hypothetical protein